jgi:hypothetical protein
MICATILEEQDQKKEVNFKVQFCVNYKKRELTNYPNGGGLYLEKFDSVKEAINWANKTDEKVIAIQTNRYGNSWINCKMVFATDRLIQVLVPPNPAWN